jgi:hypothetical protein
LSVTVDLDHRPPLSFYLSVGLVAGSIIALQIGIMRVFSVGSWAHFGSLVVSLAMFGFGLTSAVMCVGKGWFERHWVGSVKGALLAFGPLMVVCNLAAQQVPFNAIFLISDPVQKWRLFANFVLYFLPFLAGALYLGVIFLKAKKTFSRVYFADLVGSGLCGLTVLLAMYAWRPDDLIMAPLLLWLAAACCGSWRWVIAAAPQRSSSSPSCRRPCTILRRRCWASPSSPCRTTRAFPTPQVPRRQAGLRACLAVRLHRGLCQLVSAFRARPVRQRGLHLEKMPSNAYLGLYIDSEGPGRYHQGPAGRADGVLQVPADVLPLPAEEGPEDFRSPVRRWYLDGGGAEVRLQPGHGGRGQPGAALSAFREDKFLRDFTGDVLNNPKVNVIDYDGRLYVAHTKNRYDVIDLSLADSAGLSSPGGFSIVEKYSYSREAMSAYMRALTPGGILSVTLWNKEEPPKSVLKLYATMAAAARDVDGGKDIAQKFYVVSSYLSTATRALQARRLHAQGDRGTQRSHQGDVVRRDLLSGFRSTRPA